MKKFLRTIIIPGILGALTFFALYFGIKTLIKRDFTGNMEIGPVTLVIIGDSGHKTYLVYDKDTKVMYLGHTIGGYCPLYNEDGTLRVYDVEN